MIYLQHVKSTMKKGCDVELGPKTVIVGANGAGKSTVVQSAELATRGTVSDFEGRDQVKLHTALSRLFPTDKMVTEVTLSDGLDYSWRMEKKERGGFKKPEVQVPTAVRWPLQELHAVLTGSEEKVAGWFEAIVVGKLTNTDILSPLPPEVRDDVRELLKGGMKDFMKLAKLAKDKSRSLKAAATRTEKTVESMIQGVAPPMLEEEREKLQADLEALAPKPGLITQEQYESIEASITDLVRRYSEAEAAFAACAPTDPQIRVAIQKVGIARNLIQQHTAAFGAESGCWVCGSDNKVPNEQAQQLDAAAEALAPHLVAEAARDRAERTKADIEARLRQRVAEKNAVVGIAGPDPRDERDALLAKLATDDANKRTWTNARAQKAAVAQDRARAARLTTAAKALTQAGKELLESKKSDFVQSVGVYLPEGDELGVDLDAGRVGLVRDGELHSALSGAEWTRVLLALAAFWTEGSSTPCVLVPEDRAWDRDTLTSVMQALRDAPVQVILMATVDPDPVDGWTIVTV